MKCRYLMALALASSGCLDGDYNPYATAGGGGSNAGLTALEPGNACSQSSDVPVSLTLGNRSTYTLRVFWVDYACQEVDYGLLAPGGVFMTSTSATHPWRLREASSGALVFEYVTGPSPTQAVDVQVH